MGEKPQHIGTMIIARAPCGKVVAMAWDDRECGEDRVKELCGDVVRWKNLGLDVVRVERYAGDEAPEMACHPCTRCVCTLPVTGDKVAKSPWADPQAGLPEEGDEGASDDVLVLLDDDTMDVAYYDFVAGQWLDRYGMSIPEVVKWRPLGDLWPAAREVA